MVHSDGIGEGSALTVCLPHADAHLASPHAQLQMAAHSAPGHILTVLVVDGNVDAAHMLGMFIEELGHRVVIEHHPRNAIERARIERPDVCLLNIGLPDMDGKALARKIRRHPETSTAILITVTGYGQQQDRDAALGAGFDHHFAKPVDGARLTGLLCAIGKKTSHDNLQ